MATGERLRKVGVLETNGQPGGLTGILIRQSGCFRAQISHTFHDLPKHKMLAASELIPWPMAKPAFLSNVSWCIGFPQSFDADPGKRSRSLFASSPCSLRLAPYIIHYMTPECISGLVGS